MPKFRISTAFSLLSVLVILFCGSLEAQTFSPIPALKFVKRSGGLDPLPQIVTVTSTTTNFDFNSAASTTSGGNWLSVSVTGFNCCATPRAITVVVTTPANMAAGTYAGQITLTAFNNPSNSSVIPVALTVEPPGGAFFNDLPGQLSFSSKTHGSTITSQQLQIQNGGSGTLTWSLAKSTADGGNWLTVSPTSGTAPSAVSVGVNVANLPGGGLTAGSFIGQLVFSQASGGSVTIPISVVVGDNILSQINGISFTKVFGGTDPLPQTLTVPSTGTNFDFDINSYTANGGAWLSTSVVGFNCCATPRAVTAVVTTSPTMPVGTYTSEIVFTVEGNGSLAITVPVTLTVEPATQPLFNNLPGQLSYSLKTAAINSTSQEILVQNGGPGTLDWTLAKSTSDGGNWLNVSVTNGVTPSAVKVEVLPANLPGSGLLAGNFIGELVFSQPSGGSVTIPVSVVVGNNILSQINGISFTKVFGGADPLPQTLTVPSMGTNFDFDINTYTASGGSWLSANVVGFNCCATPRAVTAAITTSAAMPVGIYTGQIVFTVEGNGSMAVTVPVTLTVQPADEPAFNNLPGQLSFSLKTGSAAITSQQIQVRNGASGTLDWTLESSTSDGGNWLTVSPASGVAPSAVNVGVTVANLPQGGLVAGTFIGELVFSQPLGGSVTVPVSVVVGDNILSQINGISFTKVFGGPDPLPQILTVPSTGTNFDFDINSYTSSGGNWLSANVTGFNCCATPRAITATITTSPAMAVGTYTGEVVFTVEGNGAMAITVPVTLTVEPANGKFLDDLPGQLSFSMIPGGTKPASRSFQIRKRGTGTLAWTLQPTTSDGNKWLAISATSGNAPATVGVGIVTGALPGGGLVAGTFIGELVVKSATGSTTIPVSVTVGSNVFVQVPALTFTKTFGGANPASQSFNIAGTGSSFDFDFASYTATGGAWLSATAAEPNCCSTPWAMSANIIAGSSLPVGTYTGQIVAIAESNGSMAMTIPVTLVVQPGASIVSVAPDTGSAGSTLQSVVITGQDTNFVQGATVASFGAGIKVNSLTVNSATSATVNITIAPGAAPGTRNLIVATGSEIAALAKGFTVTGGAALSAVIPKKGTAGTTLAKVLIAGDGTHFVQGTTVATFGAGITVNSLTVNSATSARRPTSQFRRPPHRERET